MPQIVLVVDDDSSITLALKSILLKNNFDVLTATNGEEALKLIKTNKPDLIITDLVMPVMDGWHFKMKVRDNLKFKTTPIIILSGILASESTELEEEAATFYLPKPFNSSMLIEKIKKLLIDPAP